MISNERKCFTSGEYIEDSPFLAALVDSAAWENFLKEKEIYKEIERLCNEPIPESEVEHVRNYILGEIIHNEEVIEEVKEEAPEETEVVTENE